MPIQVTTDLPDLGQIDSLGNGVEDEVQVSWPDVINYGSYRIHYRETGASSWTDWGTVGEAATSESVTGLDDGIEYEFRVRTETEHRTGTWTPAEHIITRFPSPDSLTTGTPTRTSIPLTWSEYSDAENGFRVYRAREYEAGWGAWREVADLPPNTTSHTDDTVSPGRTYRYRVTAYTEDATADSGEATATTPESGRPRERTRASGWEVKVEHPSGQTLRPRLLDDPQYTPMLKDYPRVEIPVARDEKWQDPAFEDAPVTVWKDGRVLPIEELVNVRMEAGRTVLEARGGSELANRVTAEYDNKEAHLAAEELIQTHTGITANVDDPASSVQGDTVMQTGDANSEFRDHLNSPVADTDPVTIEDGKLKLQQTCFVSEAEDPDRSTDPDYPSDGNLSNGSGRGVYASTSNLEWDFTVPYRIPAADVGLKARVIPTDDAQEMQVRIKVNGSWYLLDELHGGEGTGSSTKWREFAQSEAYNGPGYEGPDIPAGSTVTVQLRSTGTSGTDYAWDVLALYDTGSRYGGFSYTWDNDNGGSSGYLDGPELKPDAFEVVFADVSTAFNVTAGKIDLTINNTAFKQAVALSNDQGATWAEASNTASYQTDFGGAGSTIRFRVTLSRYGSQSDATPKQGIYGQEVDGFTLSADLEDTPVLDGQKYDGQLIDVLNDIADYGNFIWELQRDSSGWQIEWTQPGQRTADADDSIIQYQVSKNLEHSYEKAIIKGASRPIRGEQFTSTHDTWVGLNNANLVPSTNIVRDPSTGATFELGSDYELDRTDGRIKVLSGGAMDDATTYEIDYQFKTEGSYTSSDAGSDPDTVVRTISSITSNRGCDQAALYLIQKVQDPLWKATVTVPKAEAGRSLVDDLLLSDLPTYGNRMELRDIEQTPEEVVLHLGSRQSVSDYVADISTRVGRVADRV